jgi:uncharacterized protein involved in cysteine biosynthesis
VSAVALAWGSQASSLRTTVFAVVAATLVVLGLAVAASLLFSVVAGSIGATLSVPVVQTILWRQQTRVARSNHAPSQSA